METAAPEHPAVSITMPTYKRPDMLRRAVASVQAQTFTNWELIISDDEDPPGPTWTYLQELAASDSRVRIARNPGPHGQIGNNNFVMRMARAEWVKPLFDDDTLKPNCLERFMSAVEGRPNVVMAHCLTARWVNDQPSRSDRKGNRAALELISQGHAILAMYIQDIELNIPTQVMVRRSVIDGGVLWEKVEGVFSGNDTWWYARVLQHGDLLLINEALVDQYWGHETGTTFVQNNPELFDRELSILRERYGSLVPPQVPKPPLAVVLKQLQVMRGLLRLRDGRRIEGLRMLAGVWNPLAWGMAGRWALRQYFPGRFQKVPRQVLQP